MKYPIQFRNVFCSTKSIIINQMCIEILTYPHYHKFLVTLKMKILLSLEHSKKFPSDWISLILDSSDVKSASNNNRSELFPY